MSINEPQEKLSRLMAQQESDFQITVDRYKSRALSGKTMLLAFPIEEIKKVREQDLGNYFQFILNFCDTMILFPDETIYSKLYEMGVSPKVTKWFIGIDKINKEISEISGKNIIVFKNLLLGSIILYLHSKIVAEILNEHHKVLGKEQSDKDQIPKMMQNTFRRRNYRKRQSEPFQNTFDFLINDLIDQFEDLFKGEKRAKKFYMSHMEGKTEKIYIKEIVTCFYPPEHMPQTQFAAAISGLLKLLLKDKKVLLDESEFIDADALYGNNYNRYLASRIKKIANPREPNFYER